MPRREQDASTLSAYLRAIAALPRLTIDDERALVSRIGRDGDEEALTRLVEANLRFVVGFAKRYRGLGVSFLDLIHQGNLGLLEAARRFDPDRNVKFITYAVWWIRESMMHVLSDQTRAFSFPPKMFQVLHKTSPDLSLNDPAPSRHGTEALPYERGDLLVADRVAIDDEMIHRADLDDLASALSDLDRRERAVMRLRFGLGDDQEHTLREIGERLHLSRERVRQIECRAKEKLRRSAKAQGPAKVHG